MAELNKPEQEEAEQRAIAESAARRPAPPAIREPAQVTSGDGGLAQQLDALFEQLNAGTEPESAPAGAAPAAAGAVAATAPSVEPDEQIAPAEKAALVAAIPGGTTDPSDVPETDDEERVGLVMRMLEWINLPLDYLGENVRLIAGRVAVVTLLNALVVLVYVVFFRKA